MRQLTPLLNDGVSTHVRPQRFRHPYRPIGLLIVFQNRQPRASNSEAAAIQRMDEFGLVPSLRTEANICAPRLKALEVRAGRYLAIEPLARQPDLKVIGLGCGKAHVSSAKIGRASCR